MHPTISTIQKNYVSTNLNKVEITEYDKRNITEFLYRFFNQHGQYISKINIHIEEGELLNDPDFKIYEAHMQMEMQDQLITIDWEIDTVAPSGVKKLTSNLIITAITSGMFNCLYINDKKPNCVEQTLDLLMFEMPGHDYMLVNNDHEEVFQQASEVGKQVNILKSKGDYNKALELANKHRLNLYRQINRLNNFKLKEDYGLQTINRDESLALPNPSNLINKITDSIQNLLKAVNKPD
ncbi:MAG TPA: hypothetical protein DCL21_00745, partial [Alphaproteobacteria bacterium]|nr:hypothetical protein [Alphaproteobacteria bacterium]